MFAIEKRAEEIKKADVLIVHYGGHGVIIEKEDVPYKHRLIPEDIEIHLAHPVPLMIKTFIPTTEFL